MSVLYGGIHLNRIVIPAFFGLGLFVSGQYFFGLISVSLGIIFALRLLEEHLKEKAQKGNYSADKKELFYEKLVDSISYYSQQMTSVFFSCLFWMVQGNLNILTPGHWNVGFHTAFYASSILMLITLSPLNFILKGKMREFIFVSLIVSFIDRLVHPSHFAGNYTEAIITGVSAVNVNMAIDGLFAVFSYLIRL